MVPPWHWCQPWRSIPDRVSYTRALSRHGTDKRNDTADGTPDAHDSWHGDSDTHHITLTVTLSMFLFGAPHSSSAGGRLARRFGNRLTRDRSCSAIAHPTKQRVGEDTARATLPPHRCAARRGSTRHQQEDEHTHDCGQRSPRHAALRVAPGCTVARLGQQWRQPLSELGLGGRTLEFARAGAATHPRESAADRIARSLRVGRHSRHGRRWQWP